MINVFEQPFFGFINRKNQPKHWDTEEHYIFYLGSPLSYYGSECEGEFKIAPINKRPNRCELEERSWSAEIRMTNNPESLVEEYSKKCYVLHYEKFITTN